MGQGDVPTSRGGPLRRRKEKRQLEHLAASSARDGAARMSAAHVKVLGDDEDETDQQHSNAKRDSVGVERETSAAATTPPSRPSGFHVHAVPIDQPVGDRSE